VVGAGSVVADVVEMEREEAGFARSLKDRYIERSSERAREEGKDVDPHAGSPWFLRRE
jgi:hypothetical protein